MMNTTKYIFWTTIRFIDEHSSLASSIEIIITTVDEDLRLIAKFDEPYINATETSEKIKRFISDNTVTRSRYIYAFGCYDIRYKEYDAVLPSEPESIFLVGYTHFWNGKTMFYAEVDSSMTMLQCIEKLRQTNDNTHTTTTTVDYLLLLALVSIFVAYGLFELFCCNKDSTCLLLVVQLVWPVEIGLPTLKHPEGSQGQ